MKERLKSGEVIVFTNRFEWLQAELQYKPCPFTGKKQFSLWFNGKVIASYITWPTMEIRIKNLCFMYKMEEDSVAEPMWFESENLVES